MSKTKTFLQRKKILPKAIDAEPGDITITQKVDDEDQFYIVRRLPDLSWQYRHVDETDWQALKPENGALYNAAVKCHDEGRQVGRARLRRTLRPGRSPGESQLATQLLSPHGSRKATAVAPLRKRKPEPTVDQPTVAADDNQPIQPSPTIDSNDQPPTTTDSAASTNKRIRKRLPWGLGLSRPFQEAGDRNSDAVPPAASSANPVLTPEIINQLREQERARREAEAEQNSEVDYFASEDEESINFTPGPYSPSSDETNVNWVDNSKQQGHSSTSTTNPPQPPTQFNDF